MLAKPERLGFVTEMTIGSSSERGEGPGLTVPNPATGQPLAALNFASVGQMERAIAAARRAFDEGPWPRMTRRERSEALHAFTDVLERHRDELVATIVEEVGTPIATAGPMQVDIPLAVMRFMADAAGKDRDVQLGAKFGASDSVSFVAHRPVGVVGAITAYNYPFSLAISKVGAALAAGCTTVVSASPNAPFSTLLLGRLAAEAGLPAGVVNVVVADVEGNRLLSSSPSVDKVSFTGSIEVGRQVMAQAAQTVKGVVLELGGKSAAIIMPGTALDGIVGALHLRYSRNAGQGCASPTRLLVHQRQFDRFLELSADVMPSIRTGNPWDAKTDVGPLIRPQHRDRVEGFVTDARKAGAAIVSGGRRIDDGGGWYFEPTLVAGVGNDARIAQHEIFGPVAVALPYRDLDEAVLIANDVTYGLAGYVFGADVGECVAVASRLRAGTVTINGGGAARPEAPFGGFKQSGIGRETGEWGIQEYLEPQHIQFAVRSPFARDPSF